MTRIFIALIMRVLGGVFEVPLSENVWGMSSLLLKSAALNKWPK